MDFGVGHQSRSPGLLKSSDVHEATPIKRPGAYIIENELELERGDPFHRAGGTNGQAAEADSEQDLKLVMKLVGKGRSGEPLYQVFPAIERPSGMKLAIPRVPPKEHKSSEKKKKRGEREDTMIYIEAKEGAEPIKFLIGTDKIAIKASKRSL